MTTDKLTIGVDTVGATKAAAEIDKVTGAVKKSVVATTESTKATQAQTLQIGQLGSSLGLAGQALGRVNPLVGQLTTMAGSATGVIQSLTTAGLGPMGVALGVVSIAMSAGIAALDDYREAQKKLDERIKNTTIPTLNELVGKLREAADLQQTQARLAAGRGSADEFRANEQRGAEYLASVNDRLDRARRDNSPRLGMLERERARAESVLDFRRQQTRQAEASAPSTAGSVAGVIEESGGIQFISGRLGRNGQIIAPGSGGGGANASLTTASRAERQKASEYGFASSQRAYDEQQAASAFGGADALKQKAGREAALQQEAADAFMASERSKTDFLAQQKRERDELTMAEAQKGIEVWGAYGESLGNVFGQALMSEQNVGKALQNGLKAWAKGFAIQEIGKGMSATAEGIGAATNPITAAMAPGYFAAAGQHFAAAAVVGAIGVAIPSAGGGGSRGGSGGSARIPREHNAMRSGGDSRTVVINMSGPIVATSDRAALGRELNALVGEGQRRYGAA